VLDAAGDRARGATLYVTLEPCAHHGTTPPCTDAILAAGVERVVVGACDPNPEAAGGAELLRGAGMGRREAYRLGGEEARAGAPPPPHPPTSTSKPTSPPRKRSYDA